MTICHERRQQQQIAIAILRSSKCYQPDKIGKLRDSYHTICMKLGHFALRFPTNNTHFCRLSFAWHFVACICYRILALSFFPLCFIHKILWLGSVLQNIRFHMMSSGARDLHDLLLLCQVISPLKLETIHMWNGTCIKHINLMHFECHSNSFYGHFPPFTSPTSTPTICIFHSCYLDDFAIQLQCVSLIERLETSTRNGFIDSLLL